MRNFNDCKILNLNQFRNRKFLVQCLIRISHKWHFKNVRRWICSRCCYTWFAKSFRLHDILLKKTKYASKLVAQIGLNHITIQKRKKSLLNGISGKHESGWSPRVIFWVLHFLMYINIISCRLMKEGWGQSIWSHPESIICSGCVVYR